jgi:hypothetical protein
MTDKELDKLTDHEAILLLKKEIEDLSGREDKLEKQLIETQENYHATSEQLALHEKLEAQHGILKHVFYGVISLIFMMGLIVFWGWHTGQTTIEREMAFFERILLVLIGIVGGAISSFFDIRNFTVSPNGNGGKNGNGNGNKYRNNDTG